MTAKIIEFKAKPAVRKQKGQTLCRHNHHKWMVVKKSQFDVKQGKLVTIMRCQRCGKTRHTLL